MDSSRHLVVLPGSAALGLALALFAGVSAGQQQPRSPAPSAASPAPVAPSPPPAASPAPVDPLLQAAQKEFESLEEAERKAVQDALVWTGDYNGSVDGDFGRLTFEAMRAWQRKLKANPSGILDEAQRKGLKDTAGKAKAAAKFAVVTDGLGLKIGIPRTAAPLTAKAGQGTKYHADKDVFVVETLMAPESGATLEAMFDTARQSAGDRKVNYRLLRPDFFVVAGEDKGRRFYLRVAKGPGGLRGIRLSYPVARAKDFDRLSIAVANSFEAFPAVAAAAPAPTAQRPVAPAAPPPPAKKAVLSGSGLVVGPATVLTASALLKACDDPRIGGQPVKLTVADDGAGLAIVQAPGARGPAWQRPPRADVVAEGEGLVAPVAVEGAGPIGFSSGAAATADSGVRWRLQAALQDGALGAPIFDRTGALVGIVVEGRRAPFKVAGIVPASIYGVSSSGSIALFARDNGLKFAGAAAVATSAQSAGLVVAAVGPSVVAVTCLK